MNINYTEDYKSIKSFNSTETPDFCVFVGKNGAGKTHLLQAIESGCVRIDSIDKEDVVYFNLQSFLINNQKRITARDLESEKENAWNEVVQLRDRGRLQDNHCKDQKQITNFIRKRIVDPRQRGLIATGIFLSGVPLSKLDRNTFLANAEYTLSDYQLLNSLSEICFEHRKKYVMARLPINDGGEGKSGGELEEIEKSSPWSFVNRMFETFGLPHRISPPNFTVKDFLETGGGIEYIAKPIYDDFEIGFDDLSSGERILCALAITVFQDQGKTKFPKVLLLDEIDASLHPSMVKNLLSVINDVLLKNDCKVILATHSPTTASLVNEESIFEVKPGAEREKICKVSQTKAIDILSEGLMSLEKGLVLFDQVSSRRLSIITEGNNTDHIQKAFEILEPDFLDQADIIRGTEKCSGEGQLKILFDFFKLVQHQNDVLFIFDCDVNIGNRTDGNNTHIFTLPKNERNSLTKKGIENIYPESVFDGFITTEIDSSGRETREFDPKRKADFTQHIQTLQSESDFRNYSTLIEKIESLLN